MNYNEASSCYCIGPQNGSPVCPCQMKSVEIKDGRYVQIIDLGPANNTPSPYFRSEPKVPCMFDGLEPGVYGIACPCPKCSVRC